MNLPYIPTTNAILFPILVIYPSVDIEIQFGLGFVNVYC